MNINPTQRKKVILFIKASCSPCDKAEFIIKRLRALYEFDLSIVKTNRVNIKQYGNLYGFDFYELPVFVVDEKVVSKVSVDERLIKSSLV